MHRIRTMAPALLASALLLGGQAAIAESSTSTASPAASGDVPQALLTTQQAVTLAEAMGDGHATRVKFDDDDAQPVYKVKVEAPGVAPLKLKIAAAGGRILESERDDDHDD